MKWLQGLAILAVAVAALWLLQRKPPPEPVTIKALHASRAGQYPPTLRLKAVIRHGWPHGPYLTDQICEPAGNDISPLIIEPRLLGTPQVRNLVGATLETNRRPNRRLVVVLKVRPRYVVRRQRPGVGLKPADFSGVTLVEVESYAYESRPDAAVAWRCERPPPPQGQR